MENKKEKILISVGGRFHFFNLAEQLYKKGFLEGLITSYPKFETIKYGIPHEKVRSILIKEILNRSWNKVPLFLHQFFDLQFLIDNLFDHLASRKVISSDVFVGFSSFALHSMRQAKKLGAKTILDHGSTHILFQDKILLEEYVLHGTKSQFSPRGTEKLLYEYEEADYISVPSSFAKKTFLDLGFPKERLILVPYGVDLSQFKQIPKKDNIFRVIFVGAMTLQKGVHYLLRAFVELNLPKSELLLIGSKNPEIKPFFKKYENKFKWLDSMPQRDLHKYYSQGSVFVIMSIQEGFAMVQSQAMACGLPVICTTNTGGGDIVREGKDGFIIPIRNVERLKDRLVYLYENQEVCRQMGQSAKERISQEFTWDDYGDKMIAEYKRILKHF